MIVKVESGIVTQVDMTTSQVPNGANGWVVASGSVSPGMIAEADGTFSDPAPQPLPPRRVGTFREFIELFTYEESLEFYRQAVLFPELSLWSARGGGAATFNMDDPDVREGLDFLVYLDVLTAVRAAEILAADFNNMPTFA